MAFSIGGAADIFGLGAPRGPMGEEFPPLPLPQAPAGKDPAQASYEDAIKEYLSQKREGFKSDPFDRLLEFGLATMASASRPGASALGAVGEGGLAALQGGRVARQDFQRDQAINAQDQMQRLGILGQLASANKPQYQLDRQGNVIQMNAPNGPRRVLEAPQAPLSSAGKLQSDLSARRITQDQFDAEMAALRRQGMSPVEQAATAAGLQPGTPEFQAFVRQATLKPQSQTNVTIEGDKALAKLDAERIGAFEDGVAKARNMLPDLDRMEAAIRRFPTGAGGSGILAMRQALERVGIKIDGTSEGEVIQAIQSRLAPAMRAPGSGASSDRDIQMFVDSLPNLMRSQEGNLAVIQHLRTIARRQVQEARFMRDYFDKNKSLSGVWEAMDEKLGSVFPRVNTPEEAEKLRPGSVFVDPDGIMRVR